MISDVLAEAILQIDEYIKSGMYKDFAPGTLEWIQRVRKELEQLRVHLDDPAGS